MESNMAFMQKSRNLVNAFVFWVTHVLCYCCYLEMLIVPFKIQFGLMYSSDQYLWGRWTESEMKFILRGEVDGLCEKEYVCFCVAVKYSSR